MKRTELEHIIRAAGEIASTKRIFIFGSQAILAQFPRLQTYNLTASSFEKRSVALSREVLYRSNEADVMIPDSAEKTNLVDAMLGELSAFHNTFGYYAQGVDLTTSTLPQGWEARLVEICNENTNGVSGLCLDIHDLIIAKLYAGRPKDFEFFGAVVELGLLSERTLATRLTETKISNERKKLIREQISRGFSK